MKLSETEIVKLGVLLQSKRRNLDLTLDQVKEKLLELGLVANTSDILRLERGERKIPNAILLKNLCKIYGLDVITLFQEIGYLDVEKTVSNKIKVYNKLAIAFDSPEKYLEEIDLNLKRNIIGIKTNNSIILIEKNKKIEENQDGIFKINGEYYLRKKILTPNTIILLGENLEIPIIISSEENYQELGKVIGKIIFE